MRHDSIRCLPSCTLSAARIIASSLVRPHPLVARRRPHTCVLDEQVGHMNRRHRLLRHGPASPFPCLLSRTYPVRDASCKPGHFSPSTPDPIDPPAPAPFAPSVPASIPLPPSSWRLRSLLANGVVEDGGTMVNPAVPTLAAASIVALIVSNTLVCLAQITKP